MTVAPPRLALRSLVRLLSTSIVVVAQLGLTTLVAHADPPNSPPPAGGYFSLAPVGQWSSLPSDTDCAAQVHQSSWEPRTDDGKRDNIMVDPNAVHASLAARPRAIDGAYDKRWDSWLLQRVDGQYTGTTDEIFQWAACKWGLQDNMLRAIAVRESTWYQYDTYPANRCVMHYSCGDFFTQATSASQVYCDAIAKYGYDYQKDYGQGICPKTFSIVGIMSWEDPNWGVYPDNQDGTFPFNRDSTAFAVDYIGAYLRGCYEGWEFWLKNTGTKNYAAGDIWGCVGSWYAGDWHSTDADGYISRVQTELNNTTWLQSGWPNDKPSCDQQYGCPGPDTLGNDGTGDSTPPTTTMFCNGQACSSDAYSAPVTVSMSATDGDGSGVAATRYTTDGTDPTSSSPLYGAPFSLSSTTTVKFRSWDNAGNVEATQAQLVQINAPPPPPLSVSITSPANGATVKRSTWVSIAVSASGGSGVARVEFYRDGVLIGTDSSAPYTNRWKPWVVGPHTLLAVAYDRSGNSAASTPVQVTAV